MDQIAEIFYPKEGTNFQYAKSALKWREPDCCRVTNVESNGSTLGNHEYWVPPGAEGYLQWSHSSCGVVDQNEDMFFLSFLQLIRMTEGIRNIISYNFKDWTRNTQPIVAISIPEGPYLPLSVLSVFALNVSSDQDKAPIMLPLDPDEGTDRLFHMLMDARPDIILSVRQKDEERLNAAISAVQEQNKQYQPLIVNVKTAIAHHYEEEEGMRNEESKEEILDRDRPRRNRVSHIVYTSGTTGKPKGCVSSLFSLLHYIKVKNEVHFISVKSNVFLASALAFDPCLSDIIATFCVNATLCICPRETMKMSLDRILMDLEATHILCTPSLWSGVGSEVRGKLGSLEVVALGGEVMPPRVRSWWARTRNEGDGCCNKGKIKLLSTYGVTEACIYQTAGEVFSDDTVVSKGQDIGLPFEGLIVEIWKEQEGGGNVIITERESLGLPSGTKGEIVLTGRQIDEFSGYLNLPEATRQKFLTAGGIACYRTGDRGCIDPATGRLQIFGRIGGEEGMVKINGVRVELGEIEFAIVDTIKSFDNQHIHSVVNSCVVTLTIVNEDGYKKLTAFCVLSDQCLKEMGLSQFPQDAKGIICPSGPLLTLLRARCEEKVRKGCTPSTFVIIKRIPLTRTGKINRDALPPIETCTSLYEATCPGQEPSTHLSKYGRCGHFITGELITCLNLHVSQQNMITTSASFAMLGGDSLAATRIVRALYANHHGIGNTRTLGGEFGQLEGAFNASHLIRAHSLGDYIDFLDSFSILDAVASQKITDEEFLESKFQMQNESDDTATRLFEALLQAITLGQSNLAVALLGTGANPNLKEHRKRLGKTSGRLEQRNAFKSNPMHLACVKGDLSVVWALIFLGNCNCKSPDSSGTYPIHLACSGLGDGIRNTNATYDENEDRRRLECTKLLLDVGNVPLPMKNSSKQTVLHCAARGGYSILLEYLLNRWKEDDSIKAVEQWGSKCDWQDRYVMWKKKICLLVALT
jgi:acyl-coenzyme A synthetase/AMP-(fatty) acid ligase